MSEHICKYECTGATFVTCSICDHEIYTEQLIESLQARLKASQDETDKTFKKLAEMTRMYLDLKEGIDRMHSKLKQASEMKGEG